MPDAPRQLETASPAIRRVDWLAVAPWTLLFRVPGIALGKPFILGAAGSLFLGIYPKQIAIESFSIAEIFNFVVDYVNLLIKLPAELIHHLTMLDWQASLLYALWFFGWGFLGLLIIEYTSRVLTNHPAQGLIHDAKKAFLHLPKLVGVCVLTLVATLPFAIPLLLACWALEFELVAKGLYYAWPLISLGLGIPIYLLLAGLVWFNPLALSAIVVDRADLFDATSRMYAYGYQNLLRIVGYVSFALLLGVISYYLLIVLLGGTDLVLHELLGNKSQHIWLQALLYKLPFGYACGYFYTATSAIYLLSRRDIDDQPLDELAS